MKRRPARAKMIAELFETFMAILHSASVNGHKGDELYTAVGGRISRTTARNQTNGVFSDCIRQCCWFCEHFALLRVVLRREWLIRRN